MKPGIYPALSNSDYHAAPGVSATFLKSMRKSPAHAIANRKKEAKKDPRKDKDRIWYHLIHCAILEPQALEERYIVSPEDAPKRPLKKLEDYKKTPELETLNALDWWKMFDARAEGKICINFEDWYAAMQIRENAASLKCVQDILPKSGVAECSFFAEDPETGALMRGRPDFEGPAIFADVKNCGDADASAFNRDIARMGYHIQIAHYAEVVRLARGEEQIKSAAFIAVETEAPYGLQVHPMLQGWMDQGLKERRALLDLYAKCEAQEVWPSYSDVMTACDIPAWHGRNQSEVIYDPNL